MSKFKIKKLSKELAKQAVETGITPDEWAHCCAGREPQTPDEILIAKEAAEEKARKMRTQRLARQFSLTRLTGYIGSHAVAWKSQVRLSSPNESGHEPRFAF